MQITGKRAIVLRESTKGSQWLGKNIMQITGKRAIVLWEST